MSFLPGLPALPASVNIFTAGVLAVANPLLNAANLSGPWGIFFGPIPVVLADNVVTMSFSQDARIAEYPVEGGGFASYNKVMQPFDVKMQFSRGGNAIERQLFVENIAAIAGGTTLGIAGASFNVGTTLYNVVTPEKIYVDCNVVHQEYNRKASSAGLIVIDVWLKQVRVISDPIFTNSKNPVDQAQSNNGLVQTVQRPLSLAPMIPPWGK